MPPYDALCDAAYQRERVASRKLAKTAGITEHAALRITLEQAAGSAGLPALLAARAAERTADAARRLDKRTQRAALHAAAKAGPPRAPDTWQAWFDGSAHPNPGRLGIGALLLGPGGERLEISRRAGTGNSSEAEYLALIALLEAAQTVQPRALLVHGDSRVVIDDVNGAAEKRDRGAKGLEALRTQARALIAQLDAVTLRWVPRHRNGDADRLSQQAIASWPADDIDVTAGGDGSPP